MLNVKCLIFNSKFKIQNSNLSRSGFTMVELIFIIVLIGILASIGGNLLPDNKLLNDTNFITMKIKEKQKNAIGKSNYNFGDALWSSYNIATCIDLTKDGFEKNDLQAQKPYKLHSLLNVDGNTTLCFDEYGRPYQSEQLLLIKKDINVTYNAQMRTISVMPISGYVTLKN